MTVEYVDLVDYIAIAAEVTGLQVETVMRVSRLDLADSALHAPAAGFGDTEFYPDFVDKAAVLIVHLAKNHPLPDGNKRAAWVAMRLFIEINGWIWRAAPDIDDAERAVLAVAAGEWDTSRWASGCAIASSNHASTEFNQAGHDPKSCGLRLYNRTGSGSRDLP